ncbi:hypothetical protein GCM10022247_64880 [Allokutzneria multivorans]|uniref:Secreted protein n=2 Tax=Allokutzneria multivorans TaxID=1142134 RepID=A0ABP7TSZ9_9PSEU
MRGNLRIAATIATTIAAGTVLATTASATPQAQFAAADAACGHHTKGSSAYYENCRSTSVRIRVFTTSGTYYEGCVRPYTDTELGPTINIRDSEYVNTNVSDCRWL